MPWHLQPFAGYICFLATRGRRHAFDYLSFCLIHQKPRLWVHLWVSVSRQWDTIPFSPHRSAPESPCSDNRFDQDSIWPNQSLRYFTYAIYFHCGNLQRPHACEFRLADGVPGANGYCFTFFVTTPNSTYPVCALTLYVRYSNVI